MTPASSWPEARPPSSPSAARADDSDMDAQTQANQLIEKANALHAAGRGVAAVPLYREAAELFEPYASFNLVAADILMEYDQYEDAAVAYQGVLDEHPDHDQARDGLAAANKKLGRSTKKGFFRRR